MIYGYARVSTTGQALDSQLEALSQAGASKVFQEKVSGAKAKRPQLTRLLGALQPGDTLLVTRLDRLARSTVDLLHILDRVSTAGAQFRSLADTWADTTTPHGRLIITVLGGLAEFERHLIVDRTTEGRRQAKKRGVKFGPKFKLTPEQRQHILTALAEGEKPADLARQYNISRPTISRIGKELEASNLPSSETYNF